jgi:hypothetical protein
LRRPSTFVAVLVSLAVIAAGALYGVGVLRDGHIPFISDTCRVYANHRTVRLTPEQAGHAATIAAVGVLRGLPERAVTVAFATAFQESKLRNLNGGDRDSVGLFQQRPSQGWGTPEQLSDPRYSSTQFYARLVKVNDWQQLRITEAAQAVQRSAHPEAYQRWEADATALTRAFVGGEAAAVTCKLRGGPSDTTSSEELINTLKADFPSAAVTKSGGQTVRVTVSTTSEAAEDGWRVASWLIAQSQSTGVKTVRYINREWSAKSGNWKDTEHSGPARQVVATLAG